ncbi:MAG: hypothetical protein SV760_06160, partial [Halobacteria archaeon]|nr:hypothetical protein [Halobacteria archaeon]
MLRRTPVSGETSSLLGWVIIFGVSSVFLTYHISHFIFQNPDELDIAFSWFPPVLLLLTLIFVSRRYRWDSVSGVHILRLSGWFVLGIVILAGSFLAFVVTQSLEGGEIVEPFHAMMGWATGGGVLGIVLGVYDVGHEVQERRALSAERRSHRLDRLTEHIMVLNRILRHDIRNSINVIQAHSELIAKKFPESEEHTEVIKGEVRQIVDLSEAASHIEDLVSTEEGEEDDEDSRVELGRI